MADNAESGAQPSRARVRPRRAAAWGYAVAVGSVAAAALLSMALYRLTGMPWGRVPFALFFGSVILSARQGGWGPSLVSIVLSALAADYLFLEPFGAFALDGNSLLQVAVFVAVSLFISHLTERGARAEAAAYASGESLATTLRSIGDGVIATDAEGRVTLMNPVAERLTGWREEEARGRELTEVFRIANEYTGEAVESPAARVLREGVVQGLANHTVLISRAGESTPIDDSGAPVRSQDGSLVGAVMVFHDISERRRAEEEALRMAAIVESSDAAIIGKHLDGRITSWNRAAERVYGYTAAEAIGRHISFIVPPELLGELEDILRRLAAGGRVEHLETERVRKDGVRIPVSLTISPITGPDGRPVGASTIARDITEQKRAERLLRESERQLQLVTDSAPIFISYCDAELRFNFVNGPYADRFGLSPDEVVGRTVPDLLGPEAYEAIRPHVEAALAGRRVEYEAEVPYRDLGRRFIRVQYVPHESAEGRVLGFVAVITDVTEARRAEHERAQLAAQVEAERRRLRDLVAHVPGVVWEAWGVPDESGQRIDFVSDYVEQMLGYTVEEWLRTPNFWLQVVHPEDRERAAREAHDMYEGRRGGTSEFRWLSKDGRVVHVEAQSVVVLDERGDPVGMRGVTMDISERKRSEELLRESEGRMHLAQRAARIGTWEWDVRTGGAVWSEGIWNLLGVEQGGTVTSFETFFSLIHPEDREAVRRGAEAALASGDEYAAEFRIVRPDGQTLWLASKGRVIRDEAGAAERMVGVNIDVTERVRAEEERERLLELEQAARAAAERAVERTARLQSVTAALSEALTPVEVASVIVEHALNSLGATVGAVVVRSEDVAGELELIGSAGLPAPAVDKWRRFPLSTRVPTAEAVRAGRHVLVPSMDEWLRRSPATGLLGELDGVGAMAAVPLLIEGRAIGAVGLSFPAPRAFDAEDTAFLHALARQCAQALDRARLYEAERRARVEIEASEHRYRALADSMPQIVWTARADGFMDYYNRRWYEYTGTAPGETEGWGWQPVLHPDDVERSLRRWSRSVVTGEEYEIEQRFRRASDGEYRWHLGRAEPLRDAHGRVVKWFGTATDIHDQKRAADRLRTLAEASALLSSSLDYEGTLEELARLTVTVLADYCLIDLVSPDGEATRVAATHADPSREELVRRLRDYPPDMSKEAGVAAVLRTGEASVVADVDEPVLRSITRGEEHYRLLRELGVRSFMTVPLVARERTIGALTLGSTSSRRHYALDDLSFAEEVARRAALAIDNARLYREARDANRAKDEFLATLSHELRTPLTPIIGWTHMLKAGRLPAAEGAHGLNVIEKNAQALTRLINDLLDMSSILSGKMSIERAPVDLEQAVAEAVETVRPQAEARGVALEFAPAVAAPSSAPRWVVSGDRTRLVQVFWNLLNNAVKFSGEGGRVRVGLGGADGRARVEVTDDGAGIPADFLPYVFERFRQADGTTTRAHGGLGIGLSLVRSFTEAHGGTVTAESRGPGAGSRFVVSLPLLRAADGAEARAGEGRPDDAPAGRAPQPAAPSRGRVLIVEDARDTLDMLRVAFAANGYEPFVCASAAEALRVAPDVWFDIIVSDIGLPQLDGYDLIGLLREIEHLRTVPAVALTGYASTRDAEAALNAGFDLHLPKPVDPTALISAVERLLEERGGRGGAGADVG